MDKTEIIEYLKNNLEIRIEDDSDYYSDGFKVVLYLDGEIISTDGYMVRSRG